MERMTMTTRPCLVPRTSFCAPLQRCIGVSRLPFRRLPTLTTQVLADYVDFDDKERTKDAQLQKDLSRRLLHMKLTQTVEDEEWTPMPGISINASGKGVQVKSRVVLSPAYERLEQQFATPGPESAEPLQALTSEASGEDHTFSEPSTSDDRSTSEAGASTSAASPVASSAAQPSHAAAPSMGSDATATASTDSMDLESEPQYGGIPKSILIISLVSASLTMASCVFNTLLPVYMVSELKMTMKSMGMFEGLLEAFSYIVRMFSGVVSDMMTSRKSAITLGFAMGAIAKFGMSGATEVATIFTSKAVDRLANGVQAAPRDALISDLAPATSRSSCFGFAQSMRKWGSAVGAVAVFFLMKWSGNNYQLIFTMAATLSLASCIAFVVLVPSHKRPERPEELQERAEASASASSSSSSSSPQKKTKKKGGFSVVQFCKDVANMGSDFYRMLLIVCMYGMGHISEALLESRAMEVGFGKAESTLIVATLAFVTFVAAYPLGRLDDKYGPSVTFAVGLAALAAGDLVLLMSGTHPWAVFASLVFMGIHMGVIQGPLLSIVVGLAPSNLRGTAFGIFYTVMAATAIGANSLFGTLWHSFGATTAFGFGAAMTCATLAMLPWLLPPSARKQPQLAAA